MTKKLSVIIEVSGGVVHDVHTDADVLVVLVDWDNIEEGCEAQLVATGRLKGLSPETQAQVKLCAVKNQVDLL